MTEKICYNCFHEKPKDGACSVCGYNAEQDRDKYPLALPHGTILNGKYILGRVLGQGGFGITYVAQDWKTKKRVAVKEYLPDTMATRIEGHTVSAYSGQREESFNYGKECFLSEAKTLAEFIGNENIVRIHSYFEENGTAYFVMEYVDGVSFQTYIRDQGGKIDWQDAGRVLFPIMDALGAVHAKGIIHRDVTPDNIFIMEDGTVKLLDFGAARYSLGDRSRSLDVVLKHGYAPKEQYTRRGRQGPYTDVYSVAACFYFAVTGHKPPDSIERLDEDDLIPPGSLGVKVSEAQEDALLKGLSVQAADRYQSMADFKAAMTALEKPGIASSKSSGTSDTPPKTGVKFQKFAAGLRDRKLFVPLLLAAAVFVVVVAATVIGVQSSRKKPAQNTDSVLVKDDAGTMTARNDSGTLESEAGTSETDVSDIAEEPKEEVVYLKTKQTVHYIGADTVEYYEYTYDANGNKLTDSFKTDKIRTNNTYTYDANGNRLTERYEKDGVLTGYCEYTYDTDGNMLNLISYENDGTISSQYQYYYDGAGKLLSLQYYEGTDTLKRKNEYTYDNNGNKLTDTSYGTDGTMVSQYRYLYDDAGNELSCTQYDSDNKMLNQREYTYDEAGHVLTDSFYYRNLSSDQSEWSQTKYTYDEAGNELTCLETYYDSEGQHNGSGTTYTYDERGNKLTCDKFIEGELTTTKYSYVYDEYGNVLKRTTYDGQTDDAHIQQIIEYEYIAITKQKKQ